MMSDAGSSAHHQTTLTALPTRRPPAANLLVTPNETGDAIRVEMHGAHVWLCKSLQAVLRAALTHPALEFSFAPYRRKRLGETQLVARFDAEYDEVELMVYPKDGFKRERFSRAAFLALLCDGQFQPHAAGRASPAGWVRVFAHHEYVMVETLQERGSILARLDVALAEVLAVACTHRWAYGTVGLEKSRVDSPLPHCLASVTWQREVRLTGEMQVSDAEGTEMKYHAVVLPFSPAELAGFAQAVSSAVKNVHRRRH